MNQEPEQYPRHERFDELVFRDPHAALIRTLMKTVLFTAFLTLSIIVVTAYGFVSGDPSLRPAAQLLAFALAFNTALQLFIFWRLTR